MNWNQRQPDSQYPNSQQFPNPSYPFQQVKNNENEQEFRSN